MILSAPCHASKIRIRNVEQLGEIMSMISGILRRIQSNFARNQRNMNLRWMLKTNSVSTMD